MVHGTDTSRAGRRGDRTALTIQQPPTSILPWTIGGSKPIEATTYYQVTNFTGVIESSLGTGF